MQSDHDRLRATLDELHRQLGQVDELEPELRARLTLVMEDIQTALAETPPEKAAAKPQPEEESLLQRLQDAAQSFEDSHPTLARNIGSLIDTLSRTGI